MAHVGNVVRWHPDLAQPRIIPGVVTVLKSGGETEAATCKAIIAVVVDDPFLKRQNVSS
jgi:hypothetical protein